MARYDYVEKAVKVSRREFVGALGVLGAMAWTGAYVATDVFQDRNKYIRMRQAGLYQDDAKCQARQSHNNKGLQAMYKNFAGQPMSPLAEELFHTKYVNRAALG